MRSPDQAGDLYRAVAEALAEGGPLAAYEAVTSIETRDREDAMNDYRELYAATNWYRMIPKNERRSKRDKYENVETTPWIPWPEAPQGTLPFQLDNGYIRAEGDWLDVGYCVRIFGRPEENLAPYAGPTKPRGSVWDGATDPAFDAGAMLASLWHDAVFAAARADLLGFRTLWQSVRTFIACNRRFGRMLAERTEWRRARGLETRGIERLGNVRNVLTRIGLGAGGWRAWTKREETEEAP